MKKPIILIISLLLLSTMAWSIDMVRSRRYTTKDGMPQNTVTTICQDAKGYIWIGSRSGLCRFDGRQFELFSETANGDKIGWVHKLRIDDDGETLIIKTHGDRYFRFSPATRIMTRITTPVDLGVQEPPHDKLDFDQQGMIIGGSNGISHLIHTSSNMPYVPARCENFIDRQGNIWACFDNALFEVSISESPFMIHNHTRDQANTPFASIVRCIKHLSDGSLVVCTKDKHVIVYSPNNTFRGYMTADGTLTHKRSEFIESVYDIEECKNGTLVMAMRVSGLAIIRNPLKENVTVTHLHMPQIVTDKLYSTCYDDANDIIWIGTWGHGVMRLNPNNLSLHTLLDKQKLRIRSISMIGDTVALCCNNGITLLPKGNESKAINIGDMDMAGITKMGGITIVASTGHGAYTLQNDSKGMRLKPLPIADLGTAIYDITNLGNGKVLFATPDRLVFYDIHNKTTRSLNQDYFGMGIEISEGCTEQYKDSLFVGHACGYLTIEAKEATPSGKPFLAIYADDKTTGIGMTTTVNAVALDLRLPHNISYAWRMKGDKQWQQIENQGNSISFCRYVPGDYTIEFRSTDAYGTWTDNNTSITMTVAPSWWQMIIIAIIIIMMVGLIVLSYKVMHPKKITSDDTMDIFPSAPDVTPFDREMAKMLVEHIEKNIEDASYDVVRLAEDVGMSRSQLYQQCHNILHRTPAAFIQEIRLKRAMQLIAMQQFRINEIAYKVGFSDPKYFTKVFKTKVGMTPSQYAEECHNREYKKGEETGETGGKD